MPANCYRAEKLPIYYAHEVLELGKGELLGTLKATAVSPMKIKAEETKAAVPEAYHVKIVEETDRVLVQGTFAEDSMIQILLVQESEVWRYSVETASKEFKAMCVGTFQKSDSHEIDTFINKTGLSGVYTVKLLAAEGDAPAVIYPTGVTITA